MHMVDRRLDRWRNAAFFLTGILIVIADQLSKAWIKTNLPLGQSIFEVGFFRITHVQNTGAAFGILADYTLILIFVSLIGAACLLFCGLYLRHFLPPLNSIMGVLALGLVLGGTVGNLIDRINLGRVTDFINFNYWPAFNVADSAVNVGMVIVAILLLRFYMTGEQDG